MSILKLKQIFCLCLVTRFVPVNLDDYGLQLIKTQDSVSKNIWILHETKWKITFKTGTRELLHNYQDEALKDSVCGTA